MNKPGKIVILNGTPRSGKSSVVKEIQDISKEPWVNLGVDNYMKTIPQNFQPGIGLRPGGEVPKLEPMIKAMYTALFKSIRVHSELGINVVADVGIHDFYSKPLNIYREMLSVLAGLPFTTVGVFCPIEEILKRRTLTGYSSAADIQNIPKPILLWQEYTHKDKVYDLTVDTSVMSSSECAGKILDFIK